MTKRTLLSSLIIFVSIGSLFSQDSPTVTPAGVPAESPSPSPTVATARSVRISFVPPPLEGTISLGVFDLSGRLVRVLHQQAPLDAFTIGADALQTKWDGKDDDGVDLPAGKYRAHGYLVGALQLEKVPSEPASSPIPATGDVTVKLMANPLVKNDRPNVNLTVRFDDTDSFLATTDELPLYIISEQPGITEIAAAKTGEKAIEVWQRSPAGTEHFRISKLDQMMAFDCGAFDLK